MSDNYTAADGGRYVNFNMIYHNGMNFTYKHTKNALSGSVHKTLSKAKAKTGGSQPTPVLGMSFYTNLSNNTPFTYES